MAIFQSAGIFVREVSASIPTIQAVSASNMGIVGFSQRGPADIATLVTSYNQFTRIFGDPIKESLLPLEMAAYFNNGGERAFVVRVTPADAVSADAQIQSQITDQALFEGDGTAGPFTATAGASVLRDNAGASPLVPSSISVRWRAKAALGADPTTVGANVKKRDGVTNLSFVTAQANYEGKLVTGLPAYDSALDAVVRGTVTLNFSVTASTGGPAQTIVLPVGTSSITTGTTGDATNGASATLDHRSGILSIEMHGDFVPALVDNGNLVTADYSPCSATKTAVPTGVVNGVGRLEIAHASLTPGIGNNYINVVDGSWLFTPVATTTDEPHNKAQVLVTYKINAWNLNPISAGSWGNDLRIDVTGNADFFTASTASYSRYDATVFLRNPSTNAFEAKESLTELVFDDPESPFYFPDMVNEMSDLFTVSVPGGDEAPGQLIGVPRFQVIAGGDETITTNQELSPILANGPIARRTVIITYVDSTAVTRTITDDGNGNLVGSIDPAYATTVGGVSPNGINYTTGQINVRTLNPINGASLVSVVFYSAPAETTHQERFGDTTKTYSYTVGDLYEVYTSGDDGTFDSTNYGRNQFTNSLLLSSAFRGMFALSKIDEIMQVVIPDFAGDVTISGDQVDYAELRATQPAGGDRFIILTPPAGSDAQEASDWFRFEFARYSKFAAIYSPWINITDPLANNRDKLIPPLAHVAGIYARTDANKGVGKAPAGTEDGQLRFLNSLEFTFSQGERDLLQSNKINPLRSDAQVGNAVWGARTTSLETEWQLVNVRRLFMFIERSIFNSTHWAVFENNGPGLWSKIKTQVSNFLLGLFNQGQLGGDSPSEAFEVICDDSNNTPDLINLGQVVVDVRVRPQKPAEFIEFRVAQLQIV